MSFHIALMEEPSPGSYRMGELRKVRLGGPEGPIARHVLALDNDQGNWVLEGTALAEVFCPEEWRERPVWLVWQAPEEPPYRVSRIPGVSSEFNTEVMVQMQILEKTEEGLWSPAVKLTGEALRLTGGRMTPKAKWSWAAPKMTIGSTTLG